MSNSIGAIEFISISKGIEVANEMIKNVDTELLYSRTLCPGKYITIISGNAAEVQDSIETGRDLGEGYVIDSYVINAVDESIIRGFKNKYLTKEINNAMAVVETSKICAGIKSLDTALKTSDITLQKLNLGFGIGGKLIYIVTGSLSNLEYATTEGKRVLDEKDTISVAIIPSPEPQLIKHLI